jgi:hypothetical protein
MNINQPFNKNLKHPDFKICDLPGCCCGNLVHIETDGVTRYTIIKLIIKSIAGGSTTAVFCDKYLISDTWKVAIKAKKLNV